VEGSEAPFLGRARSTALGDRLRGSTDLLIAEQAGLGTADVARIEVRGLGIAEARTPFRSSSHRWEPQAPLEGDGPIG
jgi:hypothetical protein